MANLAEAKVEITADATQFHAEAKAIRRELEALKDKEIHIRINTEGTLKDLREIARTLKGLEGDFQIGLTPTFTKAGIQDALNAVKGTPAKVRVLPEFTHASVQKEFDRVVGDHAPIISRLTAVFIPSQIQSALRAVTPKTERPTVNANVRFNRKQIITALELKTEPPPVVNVHVNVSDNFKEAINQFKLDAAASTAEVKRLAAESAKVRLETQKAAQAEKQKTAEVKKQNDSMAYQLKLEKELLRSMKVTADTQAFIRKATDDVLKLEVATVEFQKKFGESLDQNLKLVRDERKLFAKIRDDIKETQRLRSEGIKPLLDEAAVLKGILTSALRIKGLGRDNISEFLGKSIAGELLLNKLNDIYSAALRVRKVALQLGTVFATAFAAGAQAAGGLLIAAGSLVSSLEALAGLGIIAVGIKLQLQKEDVAAAKQGLVDTFKEVGTRVSNGLGEELKGFFADTSQSVRDLEPQFQKFFDKVSPAFGRLGKSFNEVLHGQAFSNILTKLGNSTQKFLDGFAQRLPRIVEGIDKIGSKLTEAKNRLKDAFGPSIFDKFTIESFIQGIETLVRTLEIAGPGIKAFKSAVGDLFSGIKVALQDVAATVGDVGPRLFGALGPIAETAAIQVGKVASAFITLASNVLPAVQQNAQGFLSTFGEAFASSIEKLAEPLSRVVNAALELGIALAPLLDTAANIIIYLDPIAVGFLNILTNLTPLALAFAGFVESVASGFGPTLGVILQGFSALASLLSTVLAPIINFLASSGLGPLIGGFLALVAPIALVTLAIIKFQVSAAAMRVRLQEITAASPAAAAAVRLFNTVATASATSSRAAARGYVEAAAAAKKSAAALKDTGAAGRVAAAGFTAQASGLRSFAAANLAAANGSRAAAVSFRLQGAAMTTIGAGARLAGTAMRGVGAAFRFALGPIGLILIGIELVIAAFKGLVTIGGGVIKFLSGDFSEGLSQMGDGFKEAASGIKDHFLGTGDEVEGTLNSELAGVDPNTDALVGKFAGIKVDAAAAVAGTGDLVSEQLKNELSKIDLADKIRGLQSIQGAGAAWVDSFVAGAKAHPIATANFLEGIGLTDLANNVRAGGTLTAENFNDAVSQTLTQLRTILGDRISDAASSAEVVRAAQAIGINIPPEVLNGLNQAAGIAGPGINKAIGNALPDNIPEAEKKANEIAKTFIKTVEEALSQADLNAALLRAFQTGFGSTQVASQLGGQIRGALALAFSFVQANPGEGGISGTLGGAFVAIFDKAIADFPNEVLGQKFANLMGTGFKFAIAASNAVLAPQIVATMSLAFDTAFATLPAVVGPKISFMLGAAFATSIGTNAASLAPQITATLSLAFDAAFVTLPAVLGPKLSAMFTTLFSTVIIDGVSLSGTFTRVFTGAFGLAMISLPAVIGPQLSTALQTGTNQALSGFGLTIQGQINAAFTTAFSGVGEAINGPLSAAFLGATGAANTFAATIGGSMQTAASNIDNALNPLRTSIPQPFSDGFGEAVRVTQSQLDTLVNSIKIAKSNIDAIDFYGSGYQIGARLAAGIRAATADLVVPAADDMGQAVRDRTPNSPAKKGPLSGIGDPLVTGGNVVKRFIMGMQSEFAHLITVSNQMAALAQFAQAGGVGAGFGGLRGLGESGASLTGRTNPAIGGRILKQDTDAQLRQGNVLQIRPGQVNITVPGTDDPREFINNLSKELMTNCIGR